MTVDYSDCGDAFGDRECDVHTMPDYGPEHDCTEECWCEPEVYYEDPYTGSKAWLHKELQ